MSDFAAGCIAAGSLMLSLASIFLSWRLERFKREVAADLDEIRLCNQEWSEAVALFKLGAIDEAQETVMRWKTRVKK